MVSFHIEQELLFEVFKSTNPRWIENNVLKIIYSGLLMAARIQE